VAGRRPVLELLRSRGPAERILLADGTGRSPVIGEIRRRAEELAVPVRVVPRSEVDKAAPGMNHQGVVALAARYRYTPMGALLAPPAPALLFLDRITDPHNLGSLLRSADGAGFDGIVVPARKSVGVTDAVRRASAGAAEVVPVARVANLSRALEDAKKKGMWVVGLDADAPETIWQSRVLERPVALVLGSEGSGLSPSVRSHCDAMVSIPPAGRLGSLNVAVAGALAMFEVARRTSSSQA
jgi:23S rRNA (guanosine2251-2'-O)-methyltransferase